MSKYRAPRNPSIDSVAARIPEEQVQRLAATAQPWKNTPRRQNENDMAVDRFAKAMRSRFARVRLPGWDDPRKYSPELLAKMLGEAICGGDPVAVGTMAAAIFARRIDRQVITEHAMRALLRGSREDQSERVAELERRLAMTMAVHPVDDRPPIPQPQGSPRR